MGGFGGGQEGRLLDLLQVAVGPAHAAPPSGDRGQGLGRDLAEGRLLEGVEHEVHFAIVGAQGGEDAAGRPEGRPVEVRGLADVVEPQEQLARTCR